MLLKLDHIAVFQANWNDKATNIQAIAEELSLGLDAMVFLDDNPVERGLVRKLLPQVAVPELPEEPAWYARTLAAAGYFEAVAFAGEDLKRAGFYQDNAKRATLQKQVGGVDAYLASLDMTITFQPFDATGRARIVQLINKSNQYNLTTRRYTDPEVAEAENDPEVFTLQVRLADIFGDNGMISVVICRPARGRSMGDRHLADELPRAGPQSGTHGAARDTEACARGGRPQADRHLPAYGPQQAGRRSLCQAWIHQGGGRRLRIDAVGTAGRGGGAGERADEGRVAGFCRGQGVDVCAPGYACTNSTSRFASVINQAISRI